MNEELRMKNEELKEICVNLRNLWCIPCILLLFAACNRRELTYSLEAEVVINADWSQSQLDEKEQQYGATAVFYPIDGTTPLTVLMGDRSQQTLRLKEGRYDVVLFNRTFDDFSNLSFRGEGHCRALEAYAKNVETRNEPPSEKVITDNPDELAVACLEGFEVTPSMLGNSSRLRFVPRKLTQDIIVCIHIKGMNKIRSATCKIDGIAESVFLVSREASGKTVTQEFSLSKPVYDSGSQTDGTLNAVISVFGFDTEIPHSLRLEALLVDGETTFKESVDEVTISKIEEEDGTISIRIDMTCLNTVPNVKEEGSSGFDADVEDWGEEENTDIGI